QAGEKGHARDVAARAVQAGDEATRDRVEPGRKDDRQRRGDGLGCEGRIVVPDDHGRLPADQIGDQSRQPISVIFRRAKFDRNVLAFDIAALLQTLAECGHQASGVAERRGAEKPNHRHRRLLRPRRERPRRRAAEQRDELASFHSMTSSARASTLSGNARPSVLAVLTLIVSSYLIGCCTGNSATFAPLRIRSTYDAARLHESSTSDP